MERKHEKMEVIILESLKIMNLMALEKKYWLMEATIEENIKKEKKKERVNGLEKIKAKLKGCL
jgi:hypothetical protein